MNQNVLFVCVGNSARSQMAEAFFNSIAKGDTSAVSAGTHPAPAVLPVVVEVMKELNIELGSQAPKALSEEMIKAADLVITMGCGVQESCPVHLGLKIDEDWGLEDPVNKSIEEVRAIRDEIKSRVIRLLAQLAVRPSSE